VWGEAPHLLLLLLFKIRMTSLEVIRQLKMNITLLYKLTTADANQPALQAHLHFSNAKADAKNAKEPAIFPCNQPDKTVKNTSGTDLPAPNSTYKKLAVQWLNKHLCFASSSVVADSFVLRNRQLLVAAKR
jgi:hypothetical protein